MEFGLDYYETKERVYEAVRRGKVAKRKHLSGKYKTYYLYFKDNLSFYAICQEREFKEYTKVLIKTVIIERGRE